MLSVLLTQKYHYFSGGRENAAPGKLMAGPGCLTDWGPPNSCNNWDVVLWIAADRDALLCGTDCSDAWRKYSISNVHNSLVGAGQPRAGETALAVSIRSCGRVGMSVHYYSV